MAYTDTDFRTKKALKEAVASGATVTVYQPGGFFTSAVPDGKASIEGPHYPRPHTWYACVVVKDGAIVKVVA
jgi:hypothetical protein